MISETAPAITGLDRRAFRAAGTVTLLAGLWLLLLVTSVPADREPVDTWTTVFEEQRSRVEVVVAQMDGQAFAQHAADPTMSDLPAGYEGYRDQAAYRAARPVQGWVNWLASLGGRRVLLAPAMLAVGVLAIGALPLAASAVARAMHRDLRAPELILLAPACVAFLRWPGLCEPLAAVLVLTGLARWLRQDRAVAVLLFSIAALTRETSLLVPLGVALSVMASTRRLRPCLPLAVPALVYAGWALVVRWRVGTFPTGSAQMGLPLVGLFRTVPHWRLFEVLVFLALCGCSWMVWCSGDRVLRGILVAHLAFLACLGPLVWWYWWGFGRVILPLFVLALIAPARRPVEAETLTDGSPHPVADPAT